MAESEYNTAEEVEFNRHKLGIIISERLQKIGDALNRCGNRVEDWELALFAKLLQHTKRACRDLLETTGKDALPAAAWNARNLLELWVWVEYCAKSVENARRFHDDALRDMVGLVDSLAALHGLRGMQNEFEALNRAKIKAVAIAELGVETIDSKFIRVEDAAKAVGLRDWYVACNKHLSKFAHPTAGLVIGIMHQENSLKDFQSVCTTQGLHFAGQCVMAFERLLSTSGRIAINHI
jgi:hypothetical protein